MLACCSSRCCLPAMTNSVSRPKLDLAKPALECLSDELALADGDI